MSRLKAVKPELIEKRLKMFVYGAAGIGKTMAAIQFPNAYIIDLERGTEHYAKSVNNSGSAVFHSNDVNDIRGQIEALLTEAHSYKTLIIDPVTILYQSIQDLWTRRFELDAKSRGKSDVAEMQDFGMRYWGKVKSDYKSIQRLLMKLDMNIIVTSHQKDLYNGNMQKTGVTFDSMKGDDYFFDHIFRLELNGNKRMAVRVKERAEIGLNKFPEVFEWSYENFLKFYGESLEKPAVTVEMATAENVAKLKNLVETVRIPEAEVEKWLSKADAEKFDEMTNEQVLKCVDYCEKKISSLTKKAA